MENPIERKALAPERASPGKAWASVILPKRASAKLPTRGKTAVEGRINGHPFRAALDPDGQKSHRLKLNERLRDAAHAEAGDVVQPTL